MVRKLSFIEPTPKVRFGPAHFALIIIIVMHVYIYSKTSISINKYMQKAGEPENDAEFLKHIAS